VKAWGVDGIDRFAHDTFQAELAHRLKSLSDGLNNSGGPPCASPDFREGACSQRFMEELGAGCIPSAGELQTSLRGKRFVSSGAEAPRRRWSAWVWAAWVSGRGRRGCVRLGLVRVPLPFAQRVVWDGHT
jgi:hypothetical protein